MEDYILPNPPVTVPESTQNIDFVMIPFPSIK